jgi:hypothetical protein
MRCDEARELMVVRSEEDLPGAGASRLAEHLERCRECREEADRTASTLEAVRDAWAPQGLPRTPDEVQAMLAEHRIEPPRRRKLAYLAAAAALLFAAFLGVRALLPDPLEPLVKEALEAGLPRLLSPNAVPLDDLSLPVLLVMKDGRPYILASYPFGDGAHTARPLDDLASFPMPKDDRRPELVLCAAADDAWLPLARTAVRLGPGLGLGNHWGELWLAGTTTDGGFGALPLMTGLSKHRPMLAARPAGSWPARAVELRITRHGDGVRYRWGRLPTTERPRILDGGDVSLTTAQIDTGGPVALTPLRDWLRKQADARADLPLRVVLLEVGEGVRYVDVLRAVECADGNGAVRFWMGFLGAVPDPGGPRLTVPPDSRASALTEHRSLIPDTLWLSISHAGHVIRRRVVLTAAEVERLLKSAKGAIQVEADAWAPWSACAPMLGSEHAVRLFFADEPGIPHGRFLEIPPAPAGEDIADVTATRRPTGGLTLGSPLEDLAGKLVRPSFPEDAAVEEVLLLLLELRTAGIEVTLD